LGLIRPNEHVHVVPLLTVQYRENVYQSGGGDCVIRIPDLTAGTLSPTTDGLRELRVVMDDPNEYRVIVGVASLTSPNSLKLGNGVEGNGQHGTGTVIIVKKS